METTQLPLYRNAAVGNFIEQQNNHRSDLGPDKQSVDPFSEVQDDNYSTHISVANAHTQLGHPGSWQMPSLNNDQGLPSPEINAALILGPKLLDEEPDCTNHGKAGARDQTAESTSDGGRSVITKIPRNAMDVQPQPNSMPPISHDAISRSQSTDTSLPTAINSQAMSPQPSSSLEPIAGHDLSIYPLQRMDSFLLTAVASGLQELQQLSASPDAWISLKSLSSFDGFTILGIRPLRDDRWLLLAKVLCPTYTNPRRDSSAEDVVDCHTENRRKRRLVGNRVSLVNTYEHGRRVESTNGRVSRLKRGNWKETEDQELSSMMEMGMPWSSIFAKFPRRSEAAVRSRWYCVLKQLAP
ncbi:uncharacterized protein HMPREF1541_00023 [Cyphellophora europaea CBS 101466]|uniref:Uncharacterized protein n=1 Tax=Cyphellophora europaea (strain CBS 101466) TaxID=1220924 RepID=W2SAW5_CYPE1|nr:uncharacterized protein HMPREF1541_00023 [Cyphellophora europaea CBS 101466]ETN45842.1 hypothetical protein HMPREF1541_00023 [Cyphellophora europaea CBS 101466]